MPKSRLDLLDFVTVCEGCGMWRGGQPLPRNGGKRNGKAVWSGLVWVSELAELSRVEVASLAPHIVCVM